MGPHADYFDDSFLFQNLIDQSMLYIDAASKGASQIAHQFSNPGGVLKGLFRIISNSSLALSLRPAAASFLASFWACLV
jgi:hypothetical protein